MQCRVVRSVLTTRQNNNRIVLIQLAVAVQPGVDPNSGQWPADGEYLQSLKILPLTPFHIGFLPWGDNILFQIKMFCFPLPISSPSHHSPKRIEGINSRVFLLEESALQYTRSMSVGAPTSTPGIGAGTPGIDYLGSTSYSYNHSTPFLQASSSESF